MDVGDGVRKAAGNRVRSRHDVVRVAYVLLEAVLAVLARLLPRFGQMHVHRDSPGGAVGDVAVFRGRLLVYAPVLDVVGQRRVVDPTQHEHAGPVATRGHHAGRGAHAGDGGFDVRPRVAADA